MATDTHAETPGPIPGHESAKPAEPQAATGKSAVAQPPVPEPAAGEPTEGNDGDNAAAAVDNGAKDREEFDQQLEILESKAEPKRWVIGKPPENDGTDDEYSVYIQRPLGYFARMRFFALVSSTIADAIKAGGSINFGGSNPFDTNAGSLRQRVGQLGSEDFADAASFMTLAMQLISYSPDFLLECYMLWLDVPISERQWAKLVMEQDHAPDRNKWGLTEDDALEMVEIFIDQNYDDIREFFTGKLPRLAQRVRERETARKARESESALSKP